MVSVLSHAPSIQHFVYDIMIAYVGCVEVCIHIIRAGQSSPVRSS